MAIRLRKVVGRWVALCAYETDKKVGDIYIDDGQHYALITKFRDENGFDFDKKIKKLMDSQKVRDADKRTDL